MIKKVYILDVECDMCKKNHIRLEQDEEPIEVNDDLSFTLEAGWKWKYKYGFVCCHLESCKLSFESVERLYGNENIK